MAQIQEFCRYTVTFLDMFLLHFGEEIQKVLKWVKIFYGAVREENDIFPSVSPEFQSRSASVHRLLHLPPPGEAVIILLRCQRIKMWMT